MASKFFGKISNFVLNLFSGEIRDTVVRTDEAIKRIDKNFDEVKNGVNKMEENVKDMRPKVNVLWKMAFAGSDSPMALNEEGQRIFDQSEIKDIILENKEMLLTAIKRENPQTAYRVQELAEEVMDLLIKNSDTLFRLKEGAYKTGVDVDTVLFAGSIFLRDIALKEFGFKAEDLDKK